MIRTVASCPFCRDGVVAFDDRLEIVFNPDAKKDTPCDHLSFFWVSLSGTVSGENWARFWERGQGLGPMDPNDLVTDLILGLTLDADPDLPAAYLVSGATAGCREEKARGTGEIWVYPPAGSPARVLFDAYAMYAYDAVALVAAVHKKARMIRMDVDG